MGKYNMDLYIKSHAILYKNIMQAKNSHSKGRRASRELVVEHREGSIISTPNRGGYLS